MSTGTGTGSSRSPSRTWARSATPRRSAFRRASSTASGLTSVAQTSIAGFRTARVTPIAPLPVPTSATRFGSSPIHSSARWTSTSVAGRGTNTRPGAIAKGRSAKVVSMVRKLFPCPMGASSQREENDVTGTVKSACPTTIRTRGSGAAEEWFGRAHEVYRASWDDAPPGSWGRAIAMLKARLLVGDWSGAEDDARWTLQQGAAGADSPIGRYAVCLALLTLGGWEEARVLADGLRTADDFPGAVGDAMAMIAAEDSVGYIEAIEAVLESFETREEYLEDVPVADTVLVLQALAARRELSVELSSPLLPA